MQRFEVSGAVRPIYGSLGVKRLKGKQPSEVFQAVDSATSPSYVENKPDVYSPAL